MGKVSKRNSSNAKKKPFRKEKNNLPKTRKDIRKEKRNVKKIHKKEYFERSKKKQVGQFVKYPNNEIDLEDDEVVNTVKNTDGMKKKGKNISDSSRFKDIEADKKREIKLKSGMQEHRKSQLLKANEDEDKIIKKLEKQLKFKKNKAGSIPKSFASDGLSYLLEVCDPKTMTAAIAAEKHLADSDSGSDFEEDLAIATGQTNKKDKKKNKEKTSNDISMDYESMDDEEDFEEEDDEEPFEEEDDEEESDMSDGNSEEDQIVNGLNGKYKVKNIPNAKRLLEINGDESEDDSNEDEEEPLPVAKKKMKKTALKNKNKSDEEDGSEDDAFEDYEEGELDDSLEDGELTEEELEMLYSDSGSTDKKKKKIKKKRKNLSDDDDVSMAAKNNCKSDNYVKPSKKSKIDKKQSKTIKEDSEEDDGDSNPEFSDDEMSVGAQSDLGGDDEEGKKLNPDGTWEDIYGRKRDKDGNIINDQEVQVSGSKYVPPHMRKLENEVETAEITQLKRQIKSLLNKVAGSNMHWISTQLESLYNSNSRYSVNNAFCSLWMAAVIQPVTSADRMVIEHSVLVAILHANVGSEIGAHFLQTVVKRFDDMLKTQQTIENKELDNLVLGLSQLYNFKIFHSSLLYDILNKFVESLSEKSIECILVILRSVGGVLRKEDPSALKLFIQNTQEKAGHLKNSSSGSRVNFLLDVLLAIKNNNMNKIPNYDPSYSEELKKSMKTIVRRGNTVIPLNIKLDDLLKADERGRWWIVGSAWESNLKPEKCGGKNKQVDSQQAHLLKLADKQRINTDLRRSIFCIIMSAEDYVDAFEKLQHLGLKHQQEREIIHVLLACCLQESKYNPYYSVLAQRFCDYDRKFQMSIQYTVWDKLKDLDTCSMFQISNLAQFLTHLFVEKGLPLSILKVVQFAELSKPTLRLMRQILLGVMLHKEPQTILEVFQRIAVSPKLHLFRESLRLFISHFLLKNSNKKENVLSEEQIVLLKERASAVDRILQSDSKLKF
ncbi:nucleolar MIF4G domain-containing protein 1 homolog isoform X2 [Arctopsyche grandis]|uniref:nucleolar MIF4G domain-containing protein 1 homolog isoform X2 n=1 Tax=Arctopsyche grandis TaxID=121162 RepID=UPI00406DA201